jgi:putative ABC transport system substrate-binding protein
MVHFRTPPLFLDKSVIGVDSPLFSCQLDSRSFVNLFNGTWVAGATSAPTKEDGAMRRRDFVAGLATVGLVLSRSAHAQGLSVPIIGVIDGRSSRDAGPARLAALARGLNETGYIVGRNVAIEYRWADGHQERLPELAADLVRQNVAIIVAPGSALAVRAAQAATKTIPIVFGTGSDPVKLGFVAAFNHPGGNITGVARQTHEVSTKRLQLLHDLVPQARPIAVLRNPTNLASGDETRELEGAARVLGLPLGVFDATGSEIETAFARLVERGYRALIVSSDNFFTGQSKRITALAARYALPAIYPYPSYAHDGGLMSYGPDNIDSWRLVGI